MRPGVTTPIDISRGATVRLAPAVGHRREVAPDRTGVGASPAPTPGAGRVAPNARLPRPPSAEAQRLTGARERHAQRPDRGGVRTTTSRGEDGTLTVGLAGLSMRALQGPQGPLVAPPSLVPLHHLERVPEGGEALAARLAPTLRRHVATYRYDSQIFAERLLEALDVAQALAPRARVEDVLEALEPAALSEADAVGGSHCVGLSQALVRDLETQGVRAALGATMFPGQGDVPYGHAFVFVPFAHPRDPRDRGVIVLEPGLNLTTPIVVRRDQPFVLELPGQRWVFTLAPGGQRVEVTRESRGDVERSTWDLAAWHNADASLTKIAAVSPKLKLVSRDEAGDVVAATVLDLDARTLTVRVGAERATVSLDDHERLRAVLGDELALLLELPDRDTLLHRIEKIIARQDDLARARAYALRRLRS